MKGSAWRWPVNGEEKKMFEIITNGCPDGYGFVRDYMGNKVFYGTVEECFSCIDNLMGVQNESNND